MRSFFLLAALLAAPAVAQLDAPAFITPPTHATWPGTYDAAVNFNPTPPAITRYEMVIDGFAGSFTLNSMWLRPARILPVDIWVNMAIAISVGVPNSATPTWAHNGSGVVVYPRANYKALKVSIPGGGTYPSDVYTAPAWAWQIPFTTPITTPAIGGSIYVEMWIYSCTEVQTGNPRAWQIDGWNHDNRAAYPKNVGKNARWNNGPACGTMPIGDTIFHQTTATNISMWAWRTARTVSTEWDLINIGIQTPGTPITVGGILCTPQVNNLVTSYWLASPAATGYTTLTGFPWLPAYNYTVMWSQQLRIDTATMAGVHLTIPHVFTSHYTPPPMGTRMPGDYRYNSATSVDDGGMVIGWQ